MCDRCDDQYDRRRFLWRAAMAGGAAIAGGVLLPDVAGALAPPVETLGLGEDTLPAARDRPTGRTGTGTGSVRAPRPAGLTPPTILPRSAWHADESIRTSDRAFAPIRKLIVHHTASPTNPKDPASWVRKTYEYHVLGRGYSDMGYNFMIDHHGVIYEARWARNYAAGEIHDGENPEGLGVIGGHALGTNTGTCGICLIGDFTVGQPTTAAIASLTQLLAWKCAAHQIDPMGADRYRSLTGEDKVFPNISGHKDVGQTICPGPAVFNQFPAIRQQVRRMVGSFPARTVDFETAIRYNYARPASKPAAASLTGMVGYRILTADGRVTSLGRAGKTRSPRDEGVTDALAIAPAPGANGYYSLDRRGGVLAFGGATWHGSLRSQRSTQPPVDLAARRTGDGYWVLAANGGVFTFGAAKWLGSLSATAGRTGPRKVRATPSGNGYWILSANGAVSAFGDAAKAGSPADRKRTDVVDLAPTATGRGYWIVLSDGAVLAFGDAKHQGDLRGKKRTPVAIGSTPSGKGYYVLTSDGAVTAFGSVKIFGGITSSGRRAVAIAPVIV